MHWCALLEFFEPFECDVDLRGRVLHASRAFRCAATRCSNWGQDSAATVLRDAELGLKSSSSAFRLSSVSPSVIRFHRLPVHGDDVVNV